MLIRTVESVVNEPFSICHLKVTIYLHVLMRQFITAELAYPLPLITHKHIHINTMSATLMGVVTLQNGVVYHVTIENPPSHRVLSKSNSLQLGTWSYHTATGVCGLETKSPPLPPGPPIKMMLSSAPDQTCHGRKDMIDL